MPETITCLVADGHTAVPEAVCAFLGDRGIHCTRARDGVDALAKLEAQRPHVAVVDPHLPRLSGLELVRAAARTAPGTAMVLYVDGADLALLTDALDAGVLGLVLKEAPLEDLHRAVAAVLDGRTYVDPVLAGPLARSFDDDRLLTRREREVLRLLADGRSNDEIGRELVIAPGTVRTHVRKAMGKLGAGTRTQAVATALRRSLIR